MTMHATPTVPTAIAEHACPAWCRVSVEDHLAQLPDYDGQLIHRADLARDGAGYEVEVAVCTTITGDLVDDGDPAVYVTTPDAWSDPAALAAFGQDVTAAADELQRLLQDRAARGGEAA